MLPHLVADTIKQKLPVTNGGYKAVDFGKTNEKVYTELTPAVSPLDR
jgi:class I fructose-bisphosphate aldolase